MCLFHLNMNIEGRVCRHSVTSSETSSAWEMFFMHNLHMVFPFMMSNWSYTEQVKNFEKWRNFEVGANCFVKSVIGSSYLNRNAKNTPAFWAFDRCSSSKIDGVMAIWKFGLFLTWWPSSMTYLFVNVTYWNCWPIPYVDQVWWWYVKAFMSYAWQNWQINRQTDERAIGDCVLAKIC